MALSKIYKFILTKSACRDLAKLEKNIAIKILKKLQFFGKSKNPISYAKKITNPKIGKYRFRTGNYRVLFDINEKGELAILNIHAIKHRKDAY